MLPSDDALGLEGCPILQQRSVRVMGEAGGGAAGVLKLDTLAAEVPVALVFNGISHAVMMATPQNLEAFALGFALSEGIVDDASDVRGIDVSHVAAVEADLPTGVDAVEVRLEVSSRSFERLKHQRRRISGRTGCGVCGVESLTALDLHCNRLPLQPWIARVDLKTVSEAVAALPGWQTLHAACGAMHAAGWVSLRHHTGEITHVMEDIGRHNALDKLLGTLARTGQLREPGFVLMSSRASHELVRKCARVGVAALATVSAPTAMGVHLAELAGLRLWGGCRPPRAILYVSGLSLDLQQQGVPLSV